MTRAVAPLATRIAPGDGRLAHALLAAGVPVRPERYAGMALTWAVAALAGGLLVTGILLTLAPDGVSPVVLGLVALLATAGAPAFTFTGFLAYPWWRASERAREVDANLPHGLNYLLALAASGMEPRALFRSLGRERAYGALAEEAALITRDLELLGLDLLTALREAQKRTPSAKFKEFLQGAVSAFTSGVDIPTFLRAKGEQFAREEVESERRSLDTIGLLAEAFLVIVVAAPLFALVLLSVMSLNQGRAPLTYGYVLVLAYVPLTQLGIAVTVHSLNPKV